jgi:hypothetical protein
MPHPQAKVHRMFELVEPIATVTFSETPTEAFLALGMRNYWDGYFAGRAAPLGPAPAEVVHAVFYNFADGEVARHIPWVWGKTTPQEAIAVRERGSAAALRQMIGDLADSPGLVRVAELATRAAVSAPTGLAIHQAVTRMPAATAAAPDGTWSNPAARTSNRPVRSRIRRTMGCGLVIRS